MLSILVERPKSTFELPEIEIKETYEIIDKMSATNARGFDNLNSKILKMIPHVASLWITHLINSIIRTRKFPEILKISRVIPIKKQNKIRSSPSSYRPISNLCVIEKVVEEHIRNNLSKYLEDNRILLPNNHGSRKGYSTETARAVLDHESQQVLEENKIATVISTDMSSAFDTVSVEILIKKLQYYGVSDITIQIIESFLTKRKQFVEIQGRKSETKDCMNYSVVQGSKLSSLLFLIYTNEVSQIHELMKDDQWMRENMKEAPTSYTNVKHCNVAYVDDSNNLITFEEPTEIIHYINKFFKILKIFYNANQLQLNSDKTALLYISRPGKAHHKDDIYLEDDPINIITKPQIHILGWQMNERLQYDTTLNQSMGIIVKNMRNMKEIAEVSDQKTKTIIANSYLLPKMLFGLPLMIGQNEKIKNIIHKSIMMVARWARGSYCFRESVFSICKSLGWETPVQLMRKQTLKLMNKIITNEKPAQLMNYIRFPRSRGNAQLGKTFSSNTKAGKRSMMYHGINLFNALPDVMKTSQCKDFAKLIKKIYIQDPPD